MRRSAMLGFSLFLLAVALGLLQLWFRPWSDETFFKLMITDIAVLAVCFVLNFLLKEHKASEKIRGGNGLD